MFKKYHSLRNGKTHKNSNSRITITSVPNPTLYAEKLFKVFNSWKLEAGVVELASEAPDHVAEGKFRTTCHGTKIEQL